MINEIIDLSNVEIDKTADYGGSDQKLGILYNGDRYMLKFPDKIDDEKRNQWNSSYSNCILSEKVCCDILDSLGFDVQATFLGKRFVDGEEKLVVACKNFVPDGYSLVSFKAIEEAVLQRKALKVPKLCDIDYIFSHTNKYFATEDTLKEARERYWDSFILDALLGNFDRHANNWSYLVNNETKEVSLAPIYDCGSCLYPQISDKGILLVMQNEQELNMRIEKFPTAALQQERNVKVNYKDFIGSLNHAECNSALKRVFPKINLKEISAIIDKEPISPERKLFYNTMIAKRYERILLPAMKKILAKETKREQCER